MVYYCISVQIISIYRYFDNIRESNLTEWVTIRNALINNPLKLVPTVQDALDFVENGSYIYPSQEDALAVQMAKQRCNLVYISNGEYLIFKYNLFLDVQAVWSYFVFKKGGAWLERWNKAIIMTSDFQMRTYNKYFTEGYQLEGTPPKCDESAYTVYAAGSSIG